MGTELACGRGVMLQWFVACFSVSEQFGCDSGVDGGNSREYMLSIIMLNQLTLTWRFLCAVGRLQHH
jgi:hypothetical protein